MGKLALDMDMLDKSACIVRGGRGGMEVWLLLVMRNGVEE
jgi:hypothetical protein